MQKRAAIYARISQSDPSVEATADQEKRCRILAEREGYEVVAVHADDGISAFTGKTRPAWLALVDGVRAEKYDVVLAVAEDRFTRSSQEKIGFQADCAKHGTIWHTLAGGKVDPATAEGGLMSTITGAIAEYESHVKRERVRASVVRRISEGKDLGGGRPFGFEPGRKVLRESEAQMIRDAHDFILAGGSLHGVTQAWAKSGMPTVNGGHRWWPTTVKQILMRARNAGLLEHKGEIVGDGLPAIVTREQHEAVVAALTAASLDAKPGRKPFTHLGTGLAACGVCGEPLASASTVTTVRGKRYERTIYRCRKRHEERGSGVTHAIIGKVDLDEVIAKAVLDSLDRITAGSAETSGDLASIARLRARRTELHESRLGLQRLFAIPGADLRDAEKQIAAIGAELEQLEVDLEAAIAANSKVSIIELARERMHLTDEFWNGGMRTRTESGLPVMDVDRFFSARADIETRAREVWESFTIEEQKRLVAALYRVEVHASFRDPEVARGSELLATDLGDGGKRYTIHARKGGTTRYVDFLPVRRLRLVQ